jgi:pimeloyl-ACP methyl ester carboxylesterase
MCFRHRLGLLAIAAATALTPACRGRASATARRIALTPCRLESVAQQTLCGTLDVWEDRAAAKGRRLTLKVAVIPALARHPEPDPLFLLAGGPGQSIIRVAGHLLPAFERVRRRRDIVLVDQRGTGDSAPLDCRLVPDDAPIEEMLGEPGLPMNELRACLERYEADPRLYTTPVAMADLDEARDALGYERINLWGASYGTRAALVYMRDFGPRVRAAVLDGVAPYSNRLPLYFARDAQRAIDLLFAHCAASPACARAYPDLAPRFRQLLAELRERPVRTIVPDPISGRPASVVIRHDDFAAGLRNILYIADSTVLVPLTIDRAVHGEMAPFVAQVTGAQRQMNRTLSLGLLFSVLCAEDAPFIGPDEVEREAAGTFLGPGLAREMLKVCEIWPRGILPPRYREPLRSDLPALLLSGELDPVTPPSWAEETLAGLSRGRHIAVAGVGHGATMQGCVPDLVDRFVTRGHADDLDVSCVASLGRPPFFVSFAGPEP